MSSSILTLPHEHAALGHAELLAWWKEHLLEDDLRTGEQEPGEAAVQKAVCSVVEELLVQLEQEHEIYGVVEELLVRLEQERAIHDVVEELLVQLEREHEEHEQEIHDAVEELLIELLVQVEKEHEEHEQEKHDVVEELLMQEINGVAEEQNPAAIAEGKKYFFARSWLLPLLPPKMWSHPEPLPRALGPASFPDEFGAQTPAGV